MTEPKTVILVFQMLLMVMLAFWFGVGGYVLHISGDLKPAWKKTKELAIELSLLGVFLIPLGVIVICAALG